MVDFNFSKTDHYNFKDIFNNPYYYLPDIPDDGGIWEYSRYRYHGMYAVIDNEWVKPLAKWIKNAMNSGDWECIEVMAGRGWLARALNEQGVEVRASDSGEDYLHRMNTLEYPSRMIDAVYDIEKKSAEEVVQNINLIKEEEPGKRFIVIICYPPDSNEDATKFVRQLPKDTLIVYIGDEEFENTANEDFDKAIIWLSTNEQHPESYRLDGFPLDAHVEGVGGDEKEENTVNASLLLGIPKK
ncbi:hypothetical protein [Bacillus sp. S10(2024)]|uniref:hypothetical protein n=1 Tax=Bacillus sp. S10(2024) TaxID=3162886 RepID=UPI003D1A61DA